VCSPTEDIVAPLVYRAPISIPVPKEISVQEWLTEIYRLNLELLEVDGMTLALPGSILADKRTNSNIVLCFVVPEPSQSWSYAEKQRHQYVISWHIFSEDGYIKTRFEFQSKSVDKDWANAASTVPNDILQNITLAAKDADVRSLPPRRV
jgi:hypothetical protein